MFTTHFCGQEISNYGRENGRVDYRAFSNAFDAVQCNDLIIATGWEYWEQENGEIDNADEIDDLNNEIDELNDKIDSLNNDIDDLENELSDLEDGLTDEIQEITVIKNIKINIDKIKEQILEYEDEIEKKQDEIYDLENEEQPECYQYFIVSDSGADIIKRYTNEILFYNETLDLYVWGVTHFGTAWDYVLTEIECEKEDGEQ